MRYDATWYRKEFQLFSSNIYFRTRTDTHPTDCATRATKFVGKLAQMKELSVKRFGTKYIRSKIIIVRDSSL